MFIAIPTGTDAPIYHWPIMTFVTIAINVVVFVFQSLDPQLTHQFMISYGTFWPHTWLTAAYLHADFEHLFGNMLFLFIYGLIVEGKVGWWRFALIYNSSAIVASMLIATLAIFSFGGAIGASCAIFALMAICFLWAPENEVEFHYAVWIGLYGSSGGFHVALQNVCFFFVAIDFLTAAFTGFTLGTSVFHLLGLIPGVLIGWSMLKYRKVNCEGYDFISIRAGKKGQTQLTDVEEAKQNIERSQRIAERKQNFELGLAAVDRYIELGHYKNAVKRFQRLAAVRNKMKLSESQLVKIINGLEKLPEEDGLYRKLLRYYLKHYDRLTVPVRMKLAKRLLDHEQPREAFRVIEPITSQGLSLTSVQQRKIDAMQATAIRQVENGAIELQNDG